MIRPQLVAVGSTSMQCILREGSNPAANQQIQNAARCFGIDLEVESGDQAQPILLGEGKHLLAIGTEESVRQLTFMATSD